MGNDLVYELSDAFREGSSERSEDELAEEVAEAHPSFRASPGATPEVLEAKGPRAV